MALTQCPDCKQSISDGAWTCPHCGYPLRASGYEYKSEATLFGLPLIHITQGIDPATGRQRIAKGIIAIGDIAIGALAIGGVAFGIIPIGGCAFGIAAIGGLAIGLVAGVGGLAAGFVAVGGGAIGWYSIGGGAIGVHIIGASTHP